MRTITFLSDYGEADEFAGVCHGVIARIAPEARIIDITHSIPRHDVRRGALVLRHALPHMPGGVHLAIVDPGVGGERRAVALRCAGEGALLVGPDNGLLWPAAEALGGVAEAVDVGHSPWRLEPVAATFHGRDIFAPVTARLAGGAELSEGGAALDPGALTRLELPAPVVEDGALIAHVLHVDRFGNLALNATHADLAGTGIRLGHPVRVAGSRGSMTLPFAVTFADVAEGKPLLYEDAWRSLAIAVNRGSAAELLGVDTLDTELRIRPL